LAEFLIFLANFAPKTMQSNAFPSAIVRVLVALIGNGKLVRKCYLRAKLVEAIAVFSPERMNGAASPFFQTVQADALSVRILSRSLMQFYVGALTSYLVSVYKGGGFSSAKGHQTPRTRTFTCA
jgi:hypothetical protein